MWIKLAIVFLNTVYVFTEIGNQNTEIEHSLLAPVAITTVYIFMGTQLIGEIFNHQMSRFLQCYVLITCTGLQISLAVMILKEYSVRPSKKYRAESARVVSTILIPFVMIMLFIIEFFVIVIQIYTEYGERNSDEGENRRDRKKQSASSTIRNILQDCAG